MKIERIRLDELKPYENNAKIHTPEQIAQIVESIQKFGMNDPIAVDENNMIIEGHGRLLALKEMGVESTEVLRLTGLTEEKKRAYILVHNQLTMNTGFDLDILEQQLKTIEKIDMTDFGFDLDFDIDMTEDDFSDEPTEPAGSQEARPPRVKLGQVWQCGRHRVMCGDSTKAEDVNKLTGGGIYGSVRY